MFKDIIPYIFSPTSDEILENLEEFLMNTRRTQIALITVHLEIIWVDLFKDELQSNIFFITITSKLSL